MDKSEQYSRIGILGTLLLIGLLVFTGAREPGQRNRRSRALQAWSIEIGAGLYDRHCRSCHGAQGEGVGQLGPAFNQRPFFTQRLKEVGWQESLESYVISVASHGRLIATRQRYAGNESTAVMPPWLTCYGGPLREDEIRDIANFILNWQPTAMGDVRLAELEIPKTNLASPRVIAVGKALFIQNCAVCHTVKTVASANRKGPDLTAIGRWAGSRKQGLSAEAYLRESFLLPQAFVVQGYSPEEIGHACGGVLGVSQLDAVVAFLLSLT